MSNKEKHKLLSDLGALEEDYDCLSDIEIDDLFTDPAKLLPLVQSIMLNNGDSIINNILFVLLFDDPRKETISNAN